LPATRQFSEEQKTVPPHVNHRATISDPLSGILDRLRAVPWSTGVASFHQHWDMDTPPGLVSLYVAAQGCFHLTIDGQSTPLLIDQGTFVLLTHGRPHHISDPAGSSHGAWTDDRWSALECDAAGRVARTTIVYGHFPTQSLGRNRLSAVFPPVACLTTASTPVLMRSTPIVDLVVQESRDAQAGWQAIVTNAVMTLFTQALRQLTLQLQADGQLHEKANWIQAALDSSIGPILARLHESPGQPWTVSLLARQARMAKSAFSERFRQMVGQPPLKYLTEYRIHLACQLLRETDFGVKEIAGHVGYESASSFSNAFKRWVGRSPADYRRNAPALAEPVPPN
jgi:AraC-like DNA-binding protein